MEFKIHHPSRILQPFVQCYLEADFRETTSVADNTLFPNGLSGIFFNYGEDSSLIIEEEYPTTAVSVFGQIDRHFKARHGAGFYSLGIMMKPTVLSWLLRVNMADLTNKVVDGLQFDKELANVHRNIGEAASTKEKIEILESYFTGLLVGKAHPNSIVDFALNILHHQEVRSMSSLAEQLNISQRHLETQFKKAVGLSPKTYSLILRFKRMEQQLKKMSTVHWPDMVFAAEYYDQTHFIKDFKRFTGHTPSEYLLTNFDLGRSYLKARE